MDDVIKVLEPFRDSTKIFESEKEPTVQRVVPELYNMTDKLNKFSKSPDKHVAAFAKALLKSLNEKMPDNRTGFQRYLCLLTLEAPYHTGIQSLGALCEDGRSVRLAHMNSQSWCWRGVES